MSLEICTGTVLFLTFTTHVLVTLGFDTDVALIIV